MIQPDFDSYLKTLCETPLSEHTEHTGRTALENLLKSVADAANGNITVQQEPRRVADKGAPDFKVSQPGTILGYVETKQVGENLDKVLKSEQLKRYRSLSDNILLTDYLHFIWIKDDGVQRESLCHATDLESRRFRVREDRAAAVAGLLRSFFSSAPEGIGRSQQLALALATRSRLLRDYLGEELFRQDKEDTKGRLYGLYQIFRDQVFHELTLKEFADAFAQMLAYGLFLAKINSSTDTVTLQNAREFVPGSFRLIRELVDFLAELDGSEYRDVHWVVEELLSIVNGLDMASIHEDLSFRGRRAISRTVRAVDEEEHRLFERDPFIYFYEDYLKAYDKATRKSRGVYYTPPPVVNFIVRGIDDILKESFGIEDGLADHRCVTVLDFACGTGTFLLEVFERIFQQIGGSESGQADLIVRDHLLKNIFGFEYLIAPYTIAHLKLSQFLKEKGHELEGDNRLKVFLTNTLEPIEPQRNLLLPAVSDEIEAAQRIKEQPILVITGNPPYSGHSKNNGEWISSRIEDYKFVDGEHFGERKHWLQDDYVKFIRFAQTKMDKVPRGIVALITNHSWISNPTFRGMRQSLLESFNQIYIIDLHGSSKPRETSPQATKNEPVFDIMKGVAISIFVKGENLEQGIWHGDIWGSRLQKYQTCVELNHREAASLRINPESPFYFFLPHSSGSKWEKLRPLDSIFTQRNVGLLTSRDKLNIAFTKVELIERLSRFVALEPSEARAEFKIRSDTNDWKISEAQDDIRSSKLDAKYMTGIGYRPFDERFVYHTGRSKGLISRPAKVLFEANRLFPLILGTVKRVEEGEFQHALVYSTVPDGHSVSSKETTHAFPLYWPAPSTSNGTESPAENFRPEFRNFLDSYYEHHYTPEEVLGYIYAVLFAPTYRKTYAEFLRNGYPRIPFAEHSNQFEALSSLGWTLVQTHLLRNIGRRGTAAYFGRGDHTIKNVSYSTEDQAIQINKTQYFKQVPHTVWEFQVGSYQVLDKYLKSRKGRKLTLDEIGHVARVADCLALTIDQMAAIDTAYKAAFDIGDKFD
ncbi:MAG: N-6 DNA methylase [Defluviicoccus sp.]|nr:N-6 DNA methylase [Defluviicoccus sp.]MDE0275666.1 N-6 DNA methylase [Defluviicoccus sp.]